MLTMVISAVLTHHRDIDDPELRNNSGWVPLPDPDIVAEALRKFRAKALELESYWDWLCRFWQDHPELRALSLPMSPADLNPPASFLKDVAGQLDTLKLPENSRAVAMLLVRGWLMASDHAVSSGVLKFRADLPCPQFPAPRRFQELLGEHNGDAFLEAPTGCGKTAAALRWALRNRGGGERVFYLLPYQASVEALADVLAQYFGRDNVSVLHSRALDYLFREYFEQFGEYGTAYAAARGEAELNQLVHKPVKVATPFQVLKWLFGMPRFEIGISEMVGGLFIFDEIHAYDAHVVALIVEMVRLLKTLGARFLFMSATFPPFLKDLLQAALGEEVPTFGLGRGDEDSWTQHCLRQIRHILRWHNKPLEALLPAIAQALRQGKRPLVVANRVAQAQYIYRQLSEHFSGVHLLHSRFTRRDRVAKERALVHALLGKRNDVLVQALVATQVVEVSLDISFDTIFTEVAPVDDLLQRFGRVNRYGEHPHGVEVHVARRFDRDSLIRVYDEERLLKTLAAAPDDGTPLTVEVAAEWVREAYREGWTSKEQCRYEQALAAFQTVLAGLRPLAALSEGEEKFYGLFQSGEVLPIKLYTEYAEHCQKKRYLLANQLLVPIPLGTFQMLNNAGLLTRQDRIVVANVAYHEVLGLLPKEVDIDAAIL